MKKHKSFLFIFSALILCLIMFTGLMGCRDDDNTPTQKYLTLGVILPMDNDNGPLRERALKTAMAEINNNGGIANGYMISLSIGSSEGTDRATAAAAAAQQIANSAQNLVGFITSYSSSSHGVVTQVADPGHYPVISGSSTADYMSGISEYFQRLCPPDSFQAMTLTHQAHTYGIQSVAIAIESNEPYASGLAQNFKNYFQGQVTGEVEFTAQDTAFETKVEQLIANNPEAIFISMLNADVYVELLTKLDQINARYDFSNTYFIFSDALHSANIFNAPLGILVGQINDHPKNFGAISAPDTTRITYQYFAEALYLKYGQEVASFNAQFYDAGYIYALAIEQAMQIADPEDIATFREVVGDLIRPVSHGETIDDPVADPIEGWPYMKALAATGGIDYVGASGNCDINSHGNTLTPYQIYTITESGGNFRFDIIGYYHP